MASTATPVTWVSKAQAARESFRRTFVHAFVGSITVASFASSLSEAKVALVSAGVAAAAAAFSAAVRVFVPLSTDKAGVAVKGV